MGGLDVNLATHDSENESSDPPGTTYHRKHTDEMRKILRKISVDDLKSRQLMSEQFESNLDFLWYFHDKLIKLISLAFLPDYIHKLSSKPKD